MQDPGSAPGRARLLTLAQRPGGQVDAGRLALLVTGTGLAAVAAIATAGRMPAVLPGVPVGYALALAAAAVASYLLLVEAASLADTRLQWVGTGCALATWAMALQIAGYPTVTYGGGPLGTTTHGAAALYLAWHVAVALAALLGSLATPPGPRVRAAYVVLGSAVLAATAWGDTPLPKLVDPLGQYAPLLRALLGSVTVLMLAATLVWWAVTRHNPRWAHLWVTVSLALGTVSLAAQTLAEARYTPLWWASLALRIAQFSVLAVGLLFGLVAVFRAMERYSGRLVEAGQRERIRSLAALAASEERFRLLVDSIADYGLLLLDREGRVESWNPGAARVTGWDESDVLGASVARFYPPELPPETVGWKLAAAAARGRYEEETWRVRKDGTRFYANVVLRALYAEDGTVRGFAEVIRDISERRQLDEQLERYALHDALTGLANRTLLLDRLAHAESRLQRHGGRMALLHVDLDRFKVVNSSLGHEAGDQLIVEVGRRLTAAVRPGDTLARVGADEFVLLCEQLPDELTAAAVAERLLGLLAEPVRLHGHETVVTASVGVAVSDGTTAGAELLRQADTAMHVAKSRGGGRAELYGHGPRERAFTRLELESDLRRAVERGELTLAYQPIVRLADGSLEGFEALLRWTHPRRGVVPPVEFVPVAEETGLIVPIGAWVLREACGQAQAWSSLMGGQPPRMSVNVSARQVGHPDLPSVVSEVLSETGLPPSALCLEITESAVLDEAESNIATLRVLRSLGVHVAIDDFGTGYSSLSRLKHLPLDRLKLDRSFVESVPAGPDAAIVAGVVRIAAALGLDVVAEGVETEEQLVALERLGTTLAQGYYLARPHPAGRWTNWLAEPSTTPAGSR